MVHGDSKTNCLNPVYKITKTFASAIAWTGLLGGIMWKYTVDTKCTFINRRRVVWRF